MSRRSPSPLKQGEGSGKQTPESSLSPRQFWLIGHVQSGEAMHHGNKQIPCLLWGETYRRVALRERLPQELITVCKDASAFFQALGRRDEARDWSLKDELIQFGILLRKGHIMLQFCARTIPEGIGSGSERSQPLPPLGIQADAKAIQRIIKRHLARKVFVERGGAQTYPARDFVQIECGDTLLAHDGSSRLENSRYHLCAITLSALLGGKHPLVVHFCLSHPIPQPYPTVILFF